MGELPRRRGPPGRRGSRQADVLRLGVGLERFALSRGHTEVIAWLRRALGQVPPEPDGLTAEAMLISPC